ncbi:phosphoethanolamine transferase [Victivallis vadensis]|uniref:phosphoethanolamine transferase n=1 Tax=Victivallis vadensis TaxID=172901 RepID=UPI00258B05BB|nr:phosphoethanolamine transferase [uncultured Victivallis sp.]
MFKTFLRHLPRPFWKFHKYYDSCLLAGSLLVLAVAETQSDYFAIIPFWPLRSIAFTLAVIAPLLLLSRRWNRLYTITIIPLAMLSIFLNCWLCHYYGRPVDETLIAILAVSSFGESREFTVEVLKSPHGWLAVAAICSTVLLCFLSWHLKFRVTPGMRRTGYLLFLPFLLLTLYFLTSRQPGQILNCATLTRIPVAIHQYQRLLEGFVKAALTPELPPELHRTSPDNLLGVIVIGESATRSHHSLYGYRRNTNPELEKQADELILFDDIISSTVQTSSSLANIFSFATLQKQTARCSLETLARYTGFKTVLLSNQLRWGEFDTPLTLLFKHVTRTVYLQTITSHVSDGNLLHFITPELTGAPTAAPTLLFIHLIGSHLPFASRSPFEYKRFPSPVEKDSNGITPHVQEIIDEYDNSILYTDHILNRILELLKIQKRPSFLLYFSDHGEAIYPGMADWRARDPDANACYEVPLFVWLSPEYRQLRPGFAEQLKNNRSRPHQTDRLLYGILDLCGITYRGFPHEDNLFSPHYRPRTRYTHEGKKVYHKTLPCQSTIFP